MRSQNLLIHLLKTGVIVYAMLFIAFSVSANDWHELAEMDQKVLIEKINELQEALDQNSFDYETIKGTGIAFHTMGRKDAKVYASKAVELLSRAVNSKCLPSFLDRGAIAFEDFEYLEALIDKKPDTLKSIRHKVYSSLAELYGKAGDESKADHYRRLAESFTL